MLFFTYLDPETIIESIDIKDLKVLLEILKGFSINCAIVTFEDYHQIEEFKDRINELPTSFETKEIKTIFSYLNKSNRFIFSLSPDYSQQQSDIECLNQQASTAEIDFVLLATSNSELYNDSPEYSIVQTYNASKFEKIRADVAYNGKIIQREEASELVFLNENFKKLLMFAKRIEICDYSLGRNFGDNYDYSLKVFFNWLSGILREPAKAEIVFHMDLPNGALDQHIKNQIKSFLTPQLSGIKITLNFYQNSVAHISLPHQRYLFTEQLSLDIGRGVDFIDKLSKKNRDTSFSYKNSSHLRLSISNCSSHLVRTLNI